MPLSDELISQFAKIAQEDTETNKESTVYGTIVNYDGEKYVQIDGSELLTPVSTTANTEVGERVTVMIKDHTATVTGNISSPAARTAEVENVGKILVAEQAKIEKLQTEKLSATDAAITYATIDNLKATNANIDTLKAEVLYAEDAILTYATIENLKAESARIDDLDTSKLSATDAEIIYAKIVDLDAAEGRIDILETTSLTADSAVIKSLEAEVGDINTLIFGSATGETIQTEFANAVIAQLGNAQIKSAMIDTVTADKIAAGNINTNHVTISSEDGSMVISDETIQIKQISQNGDGSTSEQVRVQIGKDASGDYSINIWDAEGKLMFSEGGITDSAIKEAIIRNDMVADDANISAKKLDISSLFTEINNSEKTINSSIINMDADGQTLNVAFEKMTTDVSDLSNTVSSQGTALGVVQGQIESKIWQQDINTATNEMSTKYSELEQDIGSFKTTVSETYATKTELESTSGDLSEVSSKVSELEQDVNGFKTTVSETYATKTELDSTNDALADKADSSTLTEVSTKVSSLEQDVSGFKQTVSETYATKTDLNDKADSSTLTEVSSKVSSLEQDVGSFKTTVSETYATKTALNSKADTSALTEVSTKVTELEQDVNGFKSTVSSTYVTKSDANSTYASKSDLDATNDALDDKADSSELVTVTKKVSELEQDVNGFKSTVSSTYVTKTDADGAYAAKSIESQVSQNADNITTLVSNDTEFTQFKQTVEGFKFMDKEGTVLIDAGDINLTGAITWESLASDTRDAIDSASDDAVAAQLAANSAQRKADDAYDLAESNALPSYIKSTYIDASSVNSPAIRGGIISGAKFTNLTGTVANPTYTHWLGLGPIESNEAFAFYSEELEDPIFYVYDGDDGYTSICGKNRVPWLLHDANFTKQADSVTYPLGYWDFSSAPVHGLTFDDYKPFEQIYPVGSIYLAYNHTSPASLFGGTWTRISPYFLYATGSAGTIGDIVNVITEGGTNHASGIKISAWRRTA